MEDVAIDTEEPGDGSSGFALLVSAVAAVGGFLFGFDSGVINGTVDALQGAFGASSVGTGISVASMLLGCGAGAFFAGTAADALGRRRVMNITALLFLLSAFGSGIADGVPEFVAYRVLGGLGVGAASVIAPTYIAEVAPARLRGRLASLQQLAIVLGLFFAFLNNYFVAEWAGGASASFWWDLPAWRWMFWSEIIPAVVFGIGSLVVPESPRYLVAKGEDARAEAVFAKLLGPGAAPARVIAVRESLHGSERPKLSDLVEDGRVVPVLWLAIAVACLQQLVGINVIFYYGAVLWQAAGFSESDALLTNIISGAVNISATFIAMALVDKVGRKPLLLVGSLGMTLALATTGAAFSQGTMLPGGGIEMPEVAGRVALIAANAYIVFFAATWGPIVWIMLGEVFPNRQRGAGMAVATLLHWLSNFAITMTFPMLLAGAGLSAAYAIYAGFALISFFVVQRFVRETKGRSLESQH